MFCHQCVDFMEESFRIPHTFICACISHINHFNVRNGMKLLHGLGYSKVLPFLLLSEADINFKLYKE